MFLLRRPVARGVPPVSRWCPKILLWVGRGHRPTDIVRTTITIFAHCCPPPPPHPQGGRIGTYTYVYLYDHPAGER
eukprot:3616987-Pyramimonas_sp.AAC.1